MFTRLALSLVLFAALAAANPWRTGRATFYGDQPWLWDIHKGSCGFGYRWPDVGTGWDIAALSDVHPEYSGSCGGCYEVKCDPTSFTDNYGGHLDRRGSCYDPNWSVVVTTTDTCPCNYATNLYSNKRWCCGDMDHLDLSVWTFEKLSPRRWGVIGLKYRKVSCDYKPANPAPPAKDPTAGIPPPPGVRRPAWALNVVSKGQDVAFEGGFQNGWWDKSYNVGFTEPKVGPSGAAAKCAKVYPGGAVSFASLGGKFDGRVSIEASVDTTNGTPDLSVSLVGSKGSCASVSLPGLTAAGHDSGFAKFPIYLGLFDKALQKVQAYASEFKGCAGNRPGEINTIVFRNDKSEPADLCVDGVKIL